jgi:hypothetical protein
MNANHSLKQVGRAAAPEGEGALAAVAAAAAATTPWCVRLSHQEAAFAHQDIASAGAAAVHLRTAALLRLNDRIARLLPVVDLAATHPESLGRQVCVTAVFVTAVSETAASVTDVC